MKRRLFTILSAASLLLFVAVVVLWWRSRPWNGDVIAYSVEGRRFEIASTAGVLALSAISAPAGTTSQDGFEFVPEKSLTITLCLLLKSQDDGDSAHKMGFVHFPHSGGLTVMAPHWSVALPLSALPLWWVSWAVRQRHSYQRSHCPECGYDLRATPRLCPECGVVPAKAPA